jgi:hypothetical protein
VEDVMAKRKHKPRDTGGEVYILQIWLGNTMYHKVGHTKRTARKRLIEIGTELMEQVQYFPKMRIVTNIRVSNPEAVEKDLLDQTKEHMPKDCVYKFSGWSELRILSEDELMMLYNTCINKEHKISEPRKYGM